MNKISELWHIGHEFLRNGQLKGITDSTAKEMCARKYTTQKAGEHMKVRVESKEDMKLRTSDMSPDDADAAMVVIELLRTRKGAIPGGEGGVRVPDGTKMARPGAIGDKIRGLRANPKVLVTLKGLVRKGFSGHRY